jgi:CRISPR-associated protein Csd1
MLLTRLVEHADQLRERDELPPSFYRWRTVRWVIGLAADGRPVRFSLDDLAGSDNKAGLPHKAPYIYRSGQRPPAMLMVDDLRYVLGYAGRGAAVTDKAREDARRRNESFIALAVRWRDSSADPVAAAVMNFFARGWHMELDLPDGAKPTDVAAFLVDGEWAHDQESARAFWAQVVRERKTSDRTGTCLVCGADGPLLGTIPEAVKSGAIPAGAGRARDAQLVSVNKPAQGRGGKIQLAGAPICDRCGSAAMGTLNALLADPSSRYRMKDSVLTWWVRDGSELPLRSWLDEAEPAQVKELARTVHNPSRTVGGVDAAAFCALTLSVNQSRVVVRDWLEVPVKDLQGNLRRWREQHQVASLWEDGAQFVPLWLLAACTGRYAAGDNGKGRYLLDSVPDRCERDLLGCALHGTRPPAYLLPRLTQRIRADGQIDLPRAALLRLILVRSADSLKEENYMTGLDPDLPVPSYQCGRMFAVLEQIQRAALGRDINTTIADKYLAAAAAAPLPILTMLRKNATGHLKRLHRASAGAGYALQSRLDEVMIHFDPAAGLPASFRVADQARFFLGYHHQRAADLAAARARTSKNTNDATDPGETA